MIRFLLKGILRDRSRSVLPIIVVATGVALVVILSGYMAGVLGELTNQSARFDTGHVKVMTRAYAEEISQLPNDLALLETNKLKEELSTLEPDMVWTERIRSGGLLDVPDEKGESRGQGPVAITAISLLNDEAGEAERMNIPNSLVSGALPSEAGEILIGHDFSEKLGVTLGDDVTFMGTTMNGAMSFKNFTVSGTLRFGMSALDKGAMVIDLEDARQMLDMEGGAGEILGFFPDETYNDARALALARSFNDNLAANKDEFAPTMRALSQQNNLGAYLNQATAMSGIFTLIFVLAMSVVLWNTGLLGGLRRYKEFGIRLALGEPKGRIYRSQLLEALIIGLIGSCVGLVIGLGITYYLQVVGINTGDMLKDSSMLVPPVLRARITPDLFWIGFIPGVLAILIGTALSGMGIFRRETARLMKEMEV
jgi:putative ABC transport system permease protein